MPEQLALAEKDEDTHAQIEVIRRILDEKPDDDELRERLADLWLSVEDYDMAESTVRDWANPPESVRVPVLAAVLFVRDGKRDEAVASWKAFWPNILTIWKSPVNWQAISPEWARTRRWSIF